MKELIEEQKNKGRTKTQIFSRVVGFLRPVDQWNESKQQEFGDRKVFKIK